MQELEKILEEIKGLIEKHKNKAYELVAREPLTQCYTEADIEQIKVHELAVVRDIIRKHMTDGWIPVEERLPDNRRSNYEVTFINECGYEEHGFSQWYDGEFHIPAVVIAWREHLKPYRPERSEEE